jgi:hypothetical protein
MEKNSSAGRDAAPVYPMYVDNPQFDAQSTKTFARDLTVTSGQLFAQLREALTDKLPDNSERSSILARLDTLERAKGYTFLRCYSTFIAGTANYMAVVSPFVPGLTSILTRV